MASDKADVKLQEYHVTSIVVAFTQLQQRYLLFSFGSINIDRDNKSFVYYLEIVLDKIPIARYKMRKNQLTCLIRIIYICLKVNVPSCFYGIVFIYYYNRSVLFLYYMLFLSLCNASAVVAIVLIKRIWKPIWSQLANNIFVTKVKFLFRLILYQCCVANNCYIGIEFWKLFNVPQIWQSSRTLIVILAMVYVSSRSTCHHDGLLSFPVRVQLLALYLPVLFPSTAFSETPLFSIEDCEVVL